MLQTLIDKERKLQIECWKERTRMAFAENTGASVHWHYKQVTWLARALATTDGNPNKAQRPILLKCMKKDMRLSPLQ